MQLDFSKYRLQFGMDLDDDQAEEINNHFFSSFLFSPKKGKFCSRMGSHPAANAEIPEFFAAKVSELKIWQRITQNLLFIDILYCKIYPHLKSCDRIYIKRRNPEENFSNSSEY